ncbi:3-hydroxyacyl-CoA dehydrogenase [Chryseobacterium lactis]|uniref:3-hydroxyacyl-CoA dehydrogenase n=1 Tax=Chryseobacterium lactis TaxID=1241981 RepID=A0A3G6RN43_CHRLC|nr:3-hydroxyacyl-CoA dehydrogenase [Chryseobacterium lactis]AZA84021.1 3-hydroxyacyl-CoA dehydrogenase [Chryseobacterium lactis]AZB04407.1 3-hydroxyacyl-CoA dehydrogenase [Chryseobacterium lactis]PNW12576.1 3-hydroxyacyl-CoA dehydrogenase [Chryseobacterium lactis]
MKNTNYSILALAAMGQKILTINPETGSSELLIKTPGKSPDGIVVDNVRGHIYVTNMGIPTGGETLRNNDGSIERIDLDGSNHTIIIPVGSTVTPKQLTLDRKNDRIYWCDREGMRVMSAKLDGSDIKTLVERGKGEEQMKDENRHCVGIAVDPDAGYFYWTQKGPAKGGNGRIYRAKIEMPAGESADNRSDIELLYEHLPECIDLELDQVNGYLYWTDRGLESLGGNTLNRAKLENIGKSKIEIIGAGHQEAIGLALAPDHQSVFTGDLGGHIRQFDVKTGKQKMIFEGGKELLLTGITLVKNQ